MKKDAPFQGRVHRGCCCRKHGQKDAKKRQGSIVPHALIRTINFIIFMVFPGLFQIHWLASWSINIICNNFSVDCCVCLPFTLCFTCWTRFVLFLLPVPLITPCNITYVCSDWLFDIVFLFNYLNECDNIPVWKLSCNDHLHAYTRLLKMGMIWCKKTPHCLLIFLTAITSKSLVLTESMFTSMMNFSLIISTDTT